LSEDAPAASGLERALVGALRSAIRDHVPITPAQIGQRGEGGSLASCAMRGPRLRRGARLTDEQLAWLAARDDVATLSAPTPQLVFEVRTLAAELLGLRAEVSERRAARRRE
jgi:hypothetical protein